MYNCIHCYKHTYAHDVSNWTCKRHMSVKSKAAASVCLLMPRFYNFSVIDLSLSELSPFYFQFYIFLNCRTLCFTCYISLNSLFASHHIVLALRKWFRKSDILYGQRRINFHMFCAREEEKTGIVEMDVNKKREELLNAITKT